MCSLSCVKDEAPMTSALRTTMKAVLLISLLLLNYINKAKLQSLMGKKEFSFIKLKLNNRTNVLGGQWTASSSLHCLSRCLTSYKEACQSFMYSTATLQCTPGDSIHGGLLLPATTVGDELYVMYPYFRIQTKATAMSCAVFFPDLVNYSKAKEICSFYDAYLYVPRSKETFDLFKSIVDLKLHVWVGINNIAEVGQYIGEDNGQEIKLSSIKDLFVPGQPERNWTDHCITTWPLHNSQLDDQDCNYSYAFVCQKDVEKC